MVQVLLRDFRLSGCTSFVARSPEEVYLYAANGARSRIEVFRSVPASLHWVGESEELPVPPQHIFSDGAFIYALGVNTLYQFTAGTTPVLFRTFAINCPFPTWGLFTDGYAFTPQGRSGIQSIDTATRITATPVILPVSGDFTPGSFVTITSSTPGAVIYYTTDGSTPDATDTVYSAPFAISGPGDVTVKAIALAPEFTISAVATNVYEFSDTATPAISPASGAVDPGQLVTITCSTSGSSIYYTTDGSTPDATDTLYTAPFAITGPTDKTVKAMATASGRPDSAVATNVYTFAATATPVIAPATLTQSAAFTCTITCATSGSSIYYTTDGTTPTTGSTLYTVGFSVTTDTTVKALAVATGRPDSAVASSAYVIQSAGAINGLQFDGAVYGVAVWQGLTIAVGPFTQVTDSGGAQARAGFVAIDNATGLVHTFNPGVTGLASCLAVDTSDRLWVGGSYTVINGSARGNLAFFNADRTLNAFNGAPDGAVEGLAAWDSGMAAVGPFNNMMATSRIKLAVFDSGGTLNALKLVSCNGTIHQLAVDSNLDIYFCGSFSGFEGTNGSTSRNRFGCIDSAGAYKTWDPGVNGTEGYCITISGSLVYIGGSFTTPRTKIAVLDKVGVGALQAFNPTLTGGDVRAIAVQTDTKVMVGGSFTAPSYLQRYSSAGAVDGTFSLPAGWAGAAVYALLETPGYCLAGGNFTVTGTGDYLRAFVH